MARRSKKAEPLQEAARVAVTDLDQVIGQDRAVGVLGQAMASGKIHHAWVFSGPRGVGKHTAAVAFAAALLDPDLAPDLTGRLSVDPDSHCQHLVRTGSHPDLHLINKDLAAFAEDRSVRERKRLTIAKAVIDEHLLGPIALAPAISKPGALAQKVFIIDEAERLDRSKSNAPTQASMLKTLEEPPEGSVIILVTESEHRLLTTVRSRCQRVSFSLLAADDMHTWAASEELDIGQDELDWCLRYADGSPGLATLAASTGLYAWEGELGAMLSACEQGRYAAALGPAMADLVEEWASARVKEDPTRSKEAANREATALLLRLIAQRARGRMSMFGATPADHEGALAWIDAIEEAEKQIGANVSVKLAMEDLSVRLAGG